MVPWAAETEGVVFGGRRPVRFRADRFRSLPHFGCSSGQNAFSGCFGS